MVIFDPLALPEDFDERYKVDPTELVEVLEPQGRFFYHETHADGEYTLCLYQDEPVPEELERYAVEVTERPNFHVPSGYLWFTGAEYAARDDAIEGQVVGSVLEIPKGTYRVRIMFMEYPENYVEDKIKNGLSPQERRICQRNGEFVFAGCLLTLLTPAVLWLLAFALPSLMLILALVAYWFYIYRRSRVPQYLDAVKKRDAIEHQYPSHVAEFHMLPN
jgi:hypothetical protein